VLAAPSSTEDQIRGICANHTRWFEAQAVASGGWHEAVPGGGTLAVSPDEVVLAFPRLAAKAMPEYLDRLLALCVERRPARASCWARDPQGYGATGARLAARGFEWGWQSNWMSLDLGAINTDFPVPSGLRIEIDDEAEWDVADLPYHSSQSIHNLRSLAASRPRRCWHFSAWLDDRLAGHSVLFIATGRYGVAGIYNVGVVPAARKQGVGRAVTVAACVAARELGFHYVTLNAATHIYDRIGFQSLGRGQTWWLCKNALVKPPSASEVAFAEAVGTGDLPTLDALTSLPDLDAPLACGMAPVDLAARAGKPAIVRWLVAHGATLHIVQAWDLGWKDEAARLLAANPQLASHQSGHIGTTPMHDAAFRNDVDLARLLLSARPDLTIADTEYHSTPLGWARHFDRTEIIALLEAEASRASDPTQMPDWNAAG
jgi:predicted N-acetyltransferase YhbS